MLSTISLFTDTINSFEVLLQEKRIDLTKTKIKLILRDESIIFLREIIIKEILCDYSYHWLNPDGSLIIRWDNTPHFPEISETFPHHKHVESETNVLPSNEQNLLDVLRFIKGAINQ